MLSRIQRAIEDFDLQTYVEETFDSIQSAAGGDELRINCFAPNGCARGDNKHKLYVNPDKKRWICFKCGYGTTQQPGTGSLIRFIADAEGIPPLLVRHRLARAVQPSPKEELETLLQDLFTPSIIQAPPEPRIINLGRGFYPLDHNVGNYGHGALQYASARGLNDIDLQLYNVHYCPPGFPGADKQWANRITFPIYDRQGALRSASGRLVSSDESFRPRWWHWPSTDIDQLLWPLKPVHPPRQGAIPNLAVLVEGIFDALAVVKLSPHEVFCTFGHKISAGQIRILKDMGIAKTILAWDRDSKRAMTHAAKNLEMAGIETSFIPFLYDSYWREHDLGDLMSYHSLTCLYTKGLALTAKVLLSENLENAIP